MNKVEILRHEINYIQNERIRKSCEVFVSMLPDYFFKVAAASTGKYHPAFANGEGGLVRHSKVAAYILNEIISTKTFGADFTSDEKDLLRFAILVHDGFKHGITEEQYTKHEHPLICATCFRAAKDKMNLTDEEIEYVASAIESHMGEWNTNSYSNVILPLPKTSAQKIVHLADFLSSKKILDVKFDENEIRSE